MYTARKQRKRIRLIRVCRQGLEEEQPAQHRVVIPGAAFLKVGLYAFFGKDLLYPQEVIDDGADPLVLKERDRRVFDPGKRPVAHPLPDKDIVKERQARSQPPGRS